MWDTIVFFFYIYLSRDHTTGGCIKQSLRNVYIILGTLQVGYLLASFRATYYLNLLSLRVSIPRLFVEGVRGGLTL